MKDNLYESVESFEPPLRKTPVSHTIPARVGSRGGFDAQVKNSWIEALVTQAALQRARPGERVPLPTLHHMKWAELSSALNLVLVQGKTPIQIPWVGPALPYPAPSLP